MYDRDFKFREGSRVRLKNGVDPSIYGDFGVVGNEGVIMARRKDRFDLPEVLVHWDRNHWAYNGITDTWTFEDHFELVKDNMPQDKESKLAAMFQQMAELMNSDDESNEHEDEHADDLSRRFMQAGNMMKPEKADKKDKKFAQALEAAFEQLKDSEGFIVIGVNRRPFPGQANGALEPFAAGFSRTAEADITVAVHMSRIAASTYLELAQQAIANLEEE